MRFSCGAAGKRSFWRRLTKSWKHLNWIRHPLRQNPLSSRVSKANRGISLLQDPFQTTLQKLIPIARRYRPEKSGLEKRQLRGENWISSQHKEISRLHTGKSAGAALGMTIRLCVDRAAIQYPNHATLYPSPPEIAFRGAARRPVQYNNQTRRDSPPAPLSCRPSEHREHMETSPSELKLSPSPPHSFSLSLPLSFSKTSVLPFLPAFTTASAHFSPSIAAETIPPA